MLLPIDDAILQNNPNFAAIYKTLTKGILNPDGSTANHPAQVDREAISKKLRSHRLVTAKQSILINTLSTLPLTPQSPKDRPLPADLIELIILLSHHLSTPTSNKTNTILSSDSLYDSLPSSLPTISTLISTHLHAQTLPIARLLAPTTNASYLHRQIPLLPAHITALKQAIASQTTDLRSSRAALVSLVSHIQSRYIIAFELVIRLLEQLSHGQCARSSKATADYLSLSLQDLACTAKLKELNVRSALYPREVRDALRVYGEHLRDGRGRLKQREKEAKRELARYGVGRVDEGGAEGEISLKERTMREVGRVYGEMMEEVDEVKREIGRLRAS